ncbi:thioesterase family protein [Synechococcus sp. PCC 7335]|uniref:acyl-CoA thioesterase n=1 Tax=Synechococcus sp. (strain ATCC 29403 / PCC 7335) TaxID=91464 RepID=UPI00056DB4FF|nr:thioesterase family protein [Synechococcus sp. PCC 7335]
MTFRYYRTIRFHETDAAGVVYFANILTFCHEAYEAALSEIPIDQALFFSVSNLYPIPIVHAEADYFKPLLCGDKITITLVPVQLSAYSYEVRYTFNYQQAELSTSSLSTSSLSTSLLNQPSADSQSTSEPLAIALTRHACIDKTTRKKHPIDRQLTDWLTNQTAFSGADD